MSAALPPLVAMTAERRMAVGKTTWVRMTAGEEQPGGGHAKCWPFRVGPRAIDGLSEEYTLTEQGTEMAEADAKLVLKPDKGAKKVLGGREFEEFDPGAEGMEIPVADEPSATEQETEQPEQVEDEGEAETETGDSSGRSWLPGS